MQRTSAMKRFTVDHVGSMALALAILVSGLSVLATLSLTGHVFDVGGDDAASVVASSLTTSDRAAQMDRADWLFWQQNTAQPTSGATEDSVGVPSGGVYGCPTVADLPLCQFFEPNTTLPTSGAPADGAGIRDVNE